MKHITLILALVLASTTAAFAQDRSELKGPEYKNYKPWQHETTPKLIYNVTEKEQLKSPDYKNQKPWQDTTETAVVEITVGSERSKLRGPAYKNYKPWNNKNQ
ncbi:hypothetical protein [Formosa haliotis]|uniref:hypothetical protein n=1 Tax=Formosa haliotis TaxID=1555194 RepID=UPI00082401DE|nr:hypothetical protein [Formosa haliotis]